MTTPVKPHAAAQLLEVLATVAVGALVMECRDERLHRLYAELMAECVRTRDSAEAAAKMGG